MDDTVSPHPREASARCGFRGSDAAVVSPSPPSSAASSAETVSTNDEDARRCEEWDLFAESEQGTRPPSEQLHRGNTPDERASWPSTTSEIQSDSSDDGNGSSYESDGDDADDNEGQDQQNDRDDLHDQDKMSDPASMNSPKDDEDCDAPADGRQSSSTAEELFETTTPDAIPDASKPETPSKSLPPTARSALSTPSSTRATRLLPFAHPNRIQVYVRIRPLSRGEHDGGALIPDEAANSLCVQSTQAGAVTESIVDRVFTDQSNQEDIYEAVDPGVQAALEGMNATIFAYGQTGTGKTFTMFGDDMDAPLSAGVQDDDGATSCTPSGWGLIPRTMWTLCSESCATNKSNTRIQFSCSFMQIYNDRVFDLLTDRKRQKPLVLREQPTIDGGTSVVLQGLSSELVSTFAEAIQLVRRGRANRTVRETEQNASSSRSHAIVQINLSIETPLPSGNKRIRTSRLNLVDLAGSEKWNTDVEMEDHHAAELKNINTSLSALGNCIAALAETGRRHIPYRDSTLTRLLQDSFGGNALAFLIATVSPSQKASEETIRTLQFADRARSVMQVVRVNESFSGSSELLAAKAQIKSLRERLSSEQRRRHETRIKEHEALQRDFATKLQVKEDELKRVQRDNEVFAKWREEDLKRIRALEVRVKEVENSSHEPTEDHRWPVTHANSPRSEPVINILKSNNQSMEEAAKTMPQHLDPDYHGKRLTMKTSCRTNKNQHAHLNTSHIVNERGQKQRVRSYRSLIDKYSHLRKEDLADVQDETLKPQAAPGSIHKKAPDEHTHNTHSSTNASSPQKRVQLPRSTSETVFSPTAPSYTTLDHAASDKSISEKSNVLYGSSVSFLAGSKRFLAAPSQGVSLWKTESLPSLGKTDHGEIVKPHQYQPTYLAASAVPRDFIATQAWQLPPVSSTVLAEAPSLARTESTSVVTTTQSVCAKHSLKGCVLCAANDPQPTTTLSSMPSSLKSSSSLLLNASVTSSSPPVFPDTRQACQRHQLPGCFICIKTAGDSSWRPALSFSLPLAAPSISNSGTSFPQVESLNVNRLPQDAKCPIHMLSNCVLCAGYNSHQQPAPAKRLPQPEATAWRSNQPREPSDAPASASAVSASSLSASSYRSQDLPRAHVHGHLSSPIMINRFSNDSGGDKQFCALVREASDAASLVLRRRA